jgi:alcohol dehydrogenase
MPPHVALPTTLSAAEFSPTFGVTDDVTLAKTSRRVPASAARVIVLDPDLTVYTPEWLWLSSGIRALDHAIETVYAPDHQIVADVPALEAIRLLFRHLEAARDPSAIDDRASCQIAAWLSFFAVANITLGPSHMLGRQIGPRYGAPHGYTSAVLLPAAMTSLLPSTRREQERIARAIRHGLDADEPAGAAHAAEAVYGLVDRLGLPHRLRDLKVPRDDLPSLAGGSPALLAILTAGW